MAEVITDKPTVVMQSDLVPASNVPTQEETTTPVAFPEVTQIRPCTYCECPAGHQWQPMVALAKCGHGSNQGWQGCGCPILAIKMQNCPVCNEPNAKLVMRIDHTPPVPYPVPICIPGSHTIAEVIMVQIPFRHAKGAEEALDRQRLEKEKKEQDGKAV